MDKMEIGDLVEMPDGQIGAVTGYHTDDKKVWVTPWGWNREIPFRRDEIGNHWTKYKAESHINPLADADAGMDMTKTILKIDKIGTDDLRATLEKWPQANLVYHVREDGSVSVFKNRWGICGIMSAKEFEPFLNLAQKWSILLTGCVTGIHRSVR
jgi:hypothetical protein